MACGCNATHFRNQPRFLFPIQFPPSAWPLPVIQRLGQAARHKALPHPFDTRATDTECRHDLGIRETFRRFQQDLGPLHLTGTERAFRRQGQQFVPLVVR